MTRLNDSAKELLEEHGNLRWLADAIRAALVLSEGSDAGAALLRIRLAALADALRLHNEHEEQLLGAALPGVDAWGRRTHRAR